MAKKADSSVAELDALPEEVLEKNPIIGFLMGRGRMGKSTLARYLGENAIRRGVPLLMCDADRTNKTISAYFDGIVRPDYDDDDSLRELLNKVLNDQVERRFSAIFDLEGGDRILKEHAEALGLVEFCEQFDIDPVAIHFIGTTDEDLAYLEGIEASQSFSPERTIMVFPEMIVPPGKNTERAFAPVKEHEAYKSVMARGARSVIMPRLTCIEEIEKRKLQFDDAIDGRSRSGTDQIKVSERQLTLMWKRKMDKAFADVRDWLP